jgi:hypothetical protein
MTENKRTSDANNNGKSEKKRIEILSVQSLKSLVF